MTAGAVAVLDEPFKPATLAPAAHGFIAAGLGGPPFRRRRGARDRRPSGGRSAGFAAFQNSPWRVVWVSVACGALGYATRASALALGLGLAPASLAACLAIGIASGLSSRRLQLPFAAAAFAGAAPLVPGVLIYRSIAGAIRLVTPENGADPALAVAMLSPFIEAALVVGAMVGGLVIGARLASLVQSPVDRRARTTTERGRAV